MSEDIYTKATNLALAFVAQTFECPKESSENVYRAFLNAYETARENFMKMLKEDRASKHPGSKPRISY
jgi:hypothetical protein